MVVACETENVVIWAYTVQNMMVLAQMGNILMINFTSSTSVRVDRYHLFTAVIPPAIFGSLIAALSKKLHSTYAPLDFKLKKNCSIQRSFQSLRLNDMVINVISKL